MFPVGAIGPLPGALGALDAMARNNIPDLAGAHSIWRWFSVCTGCSPIEPMMAGVSRMS
jgi:hypothetical protein